MGLTLYGYRYSVYTRIARLVLAFRGLDYQTCEVNPFATPPDANLARVSPFQFVPVLDHDGFVLCETSAITRYVAARFTGPALVPDEVKSAARMEQVMAIIDAHGYWPMVRQVFSHAVFRLAMSEPVDQSQIALGLKAATSVLTTLDGIAAEGLVLNPRQMTLADLHLAPMIGCFAMADQGRAALDAYPALQGWWQNMSRHPAYAATDPGLATLAAGG